MRLSHFWPVLLVLPACGEVVNDTSLPPRANAGADVTVSPDTEVTLDGTGSEAGSAPIDGYTWTVVAAPQDSTATLSSTDAAQVTFTPDTLGIYLVSLVVSAGSTRSAPDLTVITAATTNLAPNAVAACGPGSNCEVLHGATAQLDGRGSSDPEGDPFAVLWTQITDAEDCSQCATLDPCTPSATAVTIQNSDQELAAFTAPEARDLSLVFALTATQGAESTTDCVAYTTTNQAPVVVLATPSASVNPMNIAEGAMFTLSAIPSFDPDSDALSFTWEQVMGLPDAFGGTRDGASISVTAPDLTEPPAMTPSVDLTFRVTVTDGIDDVSTEITVAVDNS